MEGKIRKACALEGVAGVGGGGAAHADALTRALEAAAAGVQRARSLLAHAQAQALLPRALAQLQPAVSAALLRTRCGRTRYTWYKWRRVQVCAAVRRVYVSLAAARALRAPGAGGPGAPGPGAPAPGAGAALAAEPALNELALAHSRIQLYFNFLRRNAEV